MTIAPRRPHTFVLRGVYGLLLLLLVSTAWLVIAGTQLIRDIGDFARFSTTLFWLLAPLQLVLAVFFSAMLAAGNVAQEKDRKTLILLLLTRMSGSELVLGKLMASLLNILVIITISLPVFMLLALLGGISYPQIFRVILVTLFAALSCGSLGSCIALWKDKTFQALATTVLVLVIWFAVWESIGLGLFGEHLFGFPAHAVASAMSPWSAVITACRPAVDGTSADTLWSGFLLNFLGPILGFLVVNASLTIFINVFAITMVRVWNPSREVRAGTALEEDTWRKETQTAPHPERTLADRENNPQSPLPATRSEGSEPEKDRHPEAHLSAVPGAIRHAWDNPIIWREICTKAYGKKIWIIRATYVLFFVMCAWVLHGTLVSHNYTVSIENVAGSMVPIFLLSLFLVNAQAVTSLTSERDGGTLDLLLVSDITPKEFIYGKLGGVFWNIKEMLVLPLGLCVYLYVRGVVDPTNLFFLFFGLLVLYLFVAMIGVHIGIQYVNTRSAVATSLGIIFFLFIGIATCMWIMVAFSGSFETQLQPFLAMMIGGAVGLYVTLGARNPSNAILLASFALPIATFYAITSLLLGQYHLVFIAAIAAYGFTTLAMLIPAIDEFDVATGRTTAD